MPFTTDIDGQGRARTWDIGADEVMQTIVNKSGLGTTTINASQTGKMTNGLVGMWSFNGPDIDWASNTAYDRSGQGNNGAISGATAAIGARGQALSFDGVNDYITMTNTGNMSSFTLSAWIKRAAMPAVFECIFGGGADAGGYFELLDGQVTWYDGVGFRYSTTYVDDNEWHHVVGRFDNGEHTIAVDGNIEYQGDEGTYSSGTIYKIGVYRNNAERFFNGLIDEARVYNRALSADEIEDLYRMGQVIIKR